MSTSPIRIGTRASKLALWQAHWVADELRQLGATVEIVEIATQGDVQQSGPIAQLGLQGVFTKEIQAAVLRGEVDLAVHSLKDLPTETVAGLTLAAVPERASCADALVSTTGRKLKDLPPGAKIGTGSLRRQAQLRAMRPDLVIEGIRGNVGTRLSKLDSGEYDAIVLAVAGLNRLELSVRICEKLGPPQMLPAPGQGALGIECRAGDEPLLTFVGQLEHLDTRAATDAERAMLALLHAGCSAPVGAWGRIDDGKLSLDGLVASLDGSRILRASASGAAANAQQLGKQVAEELLAQGAEQLIHATREA
ncbi:hydroxymethylbilane synthase [Bythopirellula goksoeyrii]|uniref:Porphobilinogen deaminase n=1 Tax=Bythopirellula goksoeyrii TaxID=1400387 RepID=A0A5B9QJ40_9BACT|nr:hydroxymethylbilane synthase [Bythopirellula goksoeyrii]QEG34191.1 Porphobilinogen deaminase [Bythopirellula goksoeyrii]